MGDAGNGYRVAQARITRSRTPGVRAEPQARITRSHTPGVRTASKAPPATNANQQRLPSNGHRRSPVIGTTNHCQETSRYIEPRAKVTESPSAETAPGRAQEPQAWKPRPEGHTTSGAPPQQPTTSGNWSQEKAPSSAQTNQCQETSRSIRYEPLRRAPTNPLL